MTWCNVSMHNAVATSAALGLPIALAGTFSNIYYGMGTPGLSPGSLGFVYLPALLVIAIASITTAPLGAKTAHSLPVKSLKTATKVDWDAINENRPARNTRRNKTLER
jgi:uncharacterized membrane protein YfcA